MKRRFFSAIALVLIFGSFGGAEAKSSPECDSDSCCAKSDTTLCCSKEKAAYGSALRVPRGSVVEVVSFYGRDRSVACRAAERLVNEVIGAEFAGAVEDGLLQVASYDISTSEGGSMAEQYEVTSSSIYLNLWIGGQESRHDITAAGLRNAEENPEKFKALLRDKLGELLAHSI